MTVLISHHLRSAPCAHSLRYNNIGDKGVSALAAILKKTQISNLECAATRVFAFVSAPIDTAHYIPTEPHPRSLARNQLGPEGGVALAEGLKGNSMLQSLK